MIIFKHKFKDRDDMGKYAYLEILKSNLSTNHELVLLLFLL